MRLSLIEADIKVDVENDNEDNFVENFCFSFFFHKSVIHTVSDGEPGEWNVAFFNLWASKCLHCHHTDAKKDSNRPKHDKRPYISNSQGPLSNFHHSGKEGAEEEVLAPEYETESVTGTPEYVVDDGDDLEEEQKSGGVDDGLMQ